MGIKIGWSGSCRCPVFFIRCCHLIKKIDVHRNLVEILFKERLSESLYWITSRGLFHSAVLWFKGLEHRRPKTFGHKELYKWRWQYEWRTDKKLVAVFFWLKKQRSKNRVAKQTLCKVIFLDACLEVTFYVIYLKVAKYSWIVSRWTSAWRYSSPCLMSAGKDCSPSPSLLKLVRNLPATSVKTVSAFKHLKATIF